MQSEVEERNEAPKTVQGPRHLRAAQMSEQGFRPGGVVRILAACPVITRSRKLVTTRKCRKRSKGTNRVNHSSSVCGVDFRFPELFESFT